MRTGHPDSHVITSRALADNHGEVQLDISDTGTNRFEGAIETRLLEDSTVSFSRVHVIGSANLTGLHLAMREVRFGRWVTLARFKVSRADERVGALVLQAEDGTALVPARVRL